MLLLVQSLNSPFFSPHIGAEPRRAKEHSRPQSLRSFWPVVGIESSGLVQHRKSAIHGLPVKSSKSDWLTMRNEYSAHAQKIGSGQSSRSQPQARRIVSFGTRMAKEESRITCMRMLRTSPFFPPKSGESHIWKYFPHLACGAIF